MKCTVTAEDGTRRHEVEADDECEAAELWARREWIDMLQPSDLTCIVTMPEDGGVWRVVLEVERVPSFEVIDFYPLEDP